MIAGRLSVLPQTLFVLMPLFAVLLKITYIFKWRLYMEHLIVALHSHAFVFQSLLLIMLLGLLRDRGQQCSATGCDCTRVSGGRSLDLAADAPLHHAEACVPTGVVADRHQIWFHRFLLHDPARFQTGGRSLGELGNRLKSELLMHQCGASP